MPTTTKNLILIKLADEIRSMSTDEPSALDLERRIELTSWLRCSLDAVELSNEASPARYS
jgi:hypothetical protein